MHTLAAFVAAVAIQSPPAVDLNAIAQIESNHRDEAVSPAGARGRYQIMRDTWYDVTYDMREKWPYSWVHKPEYAEKVADHYLHTMIPRYLNRFEVPVTEATVVASYNAGVGRVRRSWQAGGEEGWTQHLPRETQRYLVKYAEAKQ